MRLPTYMTVTHMMPVATPLYALIATMDGVANPFPVLAIVHLRSVGEVTISSLILRDGDYYLAEDNSGFVGLTSDWSSEGAQEMSRKRIRGMRLISICDIVGGRLENDHQGRYDAEYIIDQIENARLIPDGDDPRDFEAEIYEFMVGLIARGAPTVGE